MLVINPVAQARLLTGLSHSEFASALRISKRTLQEWEQGRRSPSGAAQALFRIAQKHAKIVRKPIIRGKSSATVELFSGASLDLVNAVLNFVA